MQRSLGKGKQPPGGAGSSKQQPSKGGSSTPGRSGFPGAGGSTGSSGGGFGGLGDLFKKGSADKAAGGFGAGFGAGAGGSSGGGGGGGGWNWGGQGGSEGEEGPEKPIKQELLELAKGMWVLFWNAALFLAFADILHRSLDWCCQVGLGTEGGRGRGGRVGTNTVIQGQSRVGQGGTTWGVAGSGQTGWHRAVKGQSGALYG